MIFSFDVGIKNFAYYAENLFGRPEFAGVVDIRPYSPFKLMEILDEIFVPNSIILIEKQLPKNHKAVIVSAHLEMYFTMKDCKVIFRDSKCKDLSISEKLSYRKRKERAVDKALEYLKNLEGSDEVVAAISNAKKKDDIADAVCQLGHFRKNVLECPQNKL